MENKADVTVILTVWKRNHLEEQIESLLGQSIAPANIWVWQNLNHQAVGDLLEDYPSVKYFHSSVNLKYFGRFSIAIHSPTTYTWVLDDDIIPGPQWMHTCLSTCEKYNAIVCSNGRIIPPNDFYPEKPKSPHYVRNYFVGDGLTSHSINTCAEDTIVDFACSSYFFKTEWLQHFWCNWPVTLETAEDIHLAASCKTRAGIRTVVPKQTSALDSGNIRQVYSGDEHASWKKIGFIEQRAKVIEFFIKEKGWKPQLW